ncbi:MAG: type II toxin-antitoxin system VapC family toxin [Methylobacter sp.]
MGKINELLARIQGHRTYLDANFLIYFFDKNEPYLSITSKIIVACDRQEVFGYTGDAAVAELMVYPYRSKNEMEIARGKAFFMRENFLQILPHNSALFDTASRLRAETGMKLIDSLHCATALQAGCEFLITNDKGIRSNGTLEVILLNDWL